MRLLDSQELKLLSGGDLTVDGVKARFQPTSIPGRCFKAIQTSMQNLFDNLWSENQCYAYINHAGCIDYVDDYYDALEQADFSWQ